MIVNIFFLSQHRHGGYKTWMRHTIHALQMYGYDIRLYVIYKQTRNSLREYTGGISYQGVSMDDAIDIARDNKSKSFIGAANWDSAPEQILEMLPYCPVVLHGGLEPAEELLERAIEVGTSIGVVRKSLVGYLRRDYGINSTFLPHIYNEYDDFHLEKDLHAVSLCRIETGKNIPMLIEANQILQENMHIKMFGFYSSRYEYYKLRKLQENWKELWWGGKFESENGGAVRIASRGNYVVDMTEIPNDGGGTQYTFLEAFNARVPLLVHTGWLGIPGEITEECAVSIDSVDTLVEVLESGYNYPSHVQAGYEIMKNHSADKLLPVYKHFIGL